MLIGYKVDLPADVITAQREGQLVVFAGAGVSMSPPSNLPDFDKLAQRVARDAGHDLDWETNKPADRYLGIVEARGTDVHRAVRTVLTAPTSAPTPLHESLVALFGSRDRLRVVTTNFDSHFTTVAHTAYGLDVPIYYAPALPPGNRFQGLIYLHGSVERDPSEMILTDRDFGQAYLTEGWARRFLQAMFATFTVLFVGYSHGDPIVTYLARALPPNTKRFALHIANDPGPWQHLGVGSIPYPERPQPDRHGALRDAMTQWVARTRMGYTDHENLIRQFVSGQPPLIPVDADYLKNCLLDESTARFFAQHATKPVWLHWCFDEKLLQALFSRNGKMSRPMAILARWFADRFVADHPDDALAIVQRAHHELNPTLWLAIAGRCSMHEPKLSGQRLAQWVGVLLRNVPEGWGGDQLEGIVNICKHPADELTAIALFEHLTRPRLVLEPTFGAFIDANESTARLHFSVELGCQGYELREAWKDLFRPNINTYSRRLVPIVTVHLQRAHDLLCSVGVDVDVWDPTSFGRNAIEPHSQDKYSRAFDILIDAARDVLEHIVSVGGERARALIEDWATSEAALLRRLAVHGMARLVSLSPDQKLRWLLDQKWLFAHPLKHEVFQFLRIVYPLASTSQQRRVLRAAERGRKPRDRSVKAKRTARYETYNLLYWLAQNAPGSEITQGRFRQFANQYPDFGPRPHPDVDIWFEVGWVEPRPPITADEMLQQDPSELVDRFLEYFAAQPRQPFEGDPEDLIREIAQAVARSDTWGWELVGILDARGLWQTVIWRGILIGWRESGLEVQLVERVVRFATSHPIVAPFPHEIGDFLEEVGKRTANVLLDATIQASKDLAVAVWSAIERSMQERIVESDDWLRTAINTPAGSLVSFWTNVISTQRHRAGDSWTGLAEDDHRFLQNIVNGITLADRLGRVVLTSQLHFFYAVDRVWTREYLIPLLDWDRDRETAIPAWQGFLTWGMLTPGLVEDLVPLYEKGFDRGYQHLGERRDRYVEHVAIIAINLLGVSLPDEWLPRFIAAASTADRTNWAHQVDDVLRSLNDDARYDVWECWLRAYWEHRLQGSPLPLDGEETAAMVTWAYELPRVFPDVVALIRRSPQPIFRTADALYRLAEWDSVDLYPQAVAELLVVILSGFEGDFYFCTYAETIRGKLLRSEVSQESITAISDQLRRLGCIDEIPPAG